MSTTGKPLRADARRNREKILRAAEDVFAGRGVSASTEEVARQAGVGIGTVFRHFPTKESLLEAVYVGRLRALVDRADALAAGPDAGSAFFGFFAGLVDQSAAKHAYADALAEAGVDVKDSVARAGVGGELVRALGRLLGNAQAAGAVRADIEVPDVFALLVGATRAVEHARTDAVRARTLAVIYDGLRPAGGADGGRH